MIANFPRYPVLSWRPTMTGTVDWDDGSSTGQIDLSAWGSSYWGWSEDASHNASSDSIAGKLAAELTSETVATVSADYAWPDGDQAPMRVSYVTDTDVELTFDSAATAAQFGLDGAGPHTLLAIAPTSVDWHGAGFWAPRQRSDRDEPWKFNENVGVAESQDGSQRKIRVWGQTLTRRVLRFPAVLVADIRSDAAADSSYATAAERDTADPNNLLENLLEAARTPENTDDARAFRVYTDAAVYTTCYMLEGLNDLEALCESASVRRVWVVMLTLRDDG